MVSVFECSLNVRINLLGMVVYGQDGHLRFEWDGQDGQDGHLRFEWDGQDGHLRFE